MLSSCHDINTIKLIALDVNSDKNQEDSSTCTIIQPRASCPFINVIEHTSHPFQKGGNPKQEFHEAARQLLPQPL